MNEIRKKRNQNMFIDTACEIIETRGIEAATIRNIAAKAGYNSATLYSYFHNRSHLILCAHLKFEENIMNEMKQEVEKSNLDYYELWPHMYVIMARYYLEHPNAFECSYLYQNEKELEQEIRDLRNETSVFQKYIFGCLTRISVEHGISMDKIMRINKTCVSLMVGTLLLAVRKRIDEEQNTLLDELEESITTIIRTI